MVSSIVDSMVMSTLPDSVTRYVADEDDVRTVSPVSSSTSQELQPTLTDTTIPCST